MQHIGRRSQRDLEEDATLEAIGCFLRATERLVKATEGLQTAILEERRKRLETAAERKKWNGTQQTDIR